MRITNRSGERVTVFTANWDDTILLAPSRCEWCSPGQTLILSPSVDQKVYVRKGEWRAENFKLGKMMDATGGPFGPDFELLIIKQGGWRVVDWGSLVARYVKPTTTLGQSTRVDAAKSATAAVRAIATFLSIVFPPAQPVVKMLSDVVLSAIENWTANAPVSVSDQQQALLRAISEIVRTALNRQHAEEAASCFLNSVAWIEDEQEEIKNTGGMLSVHDTDDFKDGLHDILKAGGNFMNYLTHMNLHADEAQYIVPVYLHAIAAFLKLRWMHLMARASEGTVITAGELANEMAQIGKCLDGLRNVRALVASQVSDIIGTSGLNDATEVAEFTLLSEALYQARIGLPSLNPVDEVIDALVQIQSVYDADRLDLLAGKKASRVLKTGWFA